MIVLSHLARLGLRPISPAAIYPFIDSFIPARIREDQAAHQRARMFLISHVFGPFLGHTITTYLFWLEQTVSFALAVLALSITAFWAFPFVLRWTGWYNFLAILSIQNLIFAIFWGCYQYGGVSSPFLPWLLTVPLFAFFYLGAGVWQRYVVFGILAVNLGAVFAAAYVYGASFPENVPLERLSGIGILSNICAAVYVSMMALYYANIVASQVELEREVVRHLATAKQLQDAKIEAERASKAKSEFLARMSHELRTPLNAVIGYSEMLLEDAEAAGRSDQSADLRKINSAGKYLLALVSDVLDLSKLEAGKMELFCETVDLAAFVDSVAAASRTAIEARGNRLIVERPQVLGTAITDAAKLGQALMNLLSNAGKFTQNGTVTLKAEVEEGSIILSVRDTGAGISPQNLLNLFQNFGEAEGATASKYGGTGLGLALSQKLCRLMGGDIGVESQLGKGSCFTICVPLNPSRASASPASIRDGASAAAPGRPMILLIDDDPSIVDAAERILSDEGCETLRAEDAEEGTRLAREMRPAAVILDIRRPGNRGWQVLAALNGDEDLRDCPVLLVVAGNLVKNASGLGAAGQLAPPIQRDALLRALAGCLARDRQPKDASAEPSLARA